MCVWEREGQNYDEHDDYGDDAMNMILWFSMVQIISNDPRIALFSHLVHPKIDMIARLVAMVIIIGMD